MAETIEELRLANKKLQNENIELKKKLALYEKDAPARAYYVLNKIVNQQVDILTEFDLDSEIKKSPKDDKYFDRAKGLWEGLKEVSSDLNAMKVEFKLTGDPSKDEKNVPFIETVAETRQ